LRESLDRIQAVQERATQALQIAEQNNLSLLTIALDHLTLGRVALYGALLDGSAFVDPRESCSAAADHLHEAVTGLIQAGRADHIPRGLLTRAWLHVLLGDLAAAEADLNEAHEIAAAGPMPLFLADIALHRARLFGGREGDKEKGRLGEGETRNSYPWESVAADLATARELIEKHGYLRRLPELEDAEAALLT
jgi:hypothetical protein